VSEIIAYHRPAGRRAIPQYTLGHLERIGRAEQAQAALPGLFLCASYRGGVAVGDCIQSALQVAGIVETYVKDAVAAGSVGTLR
jgi:oxygen-dependent protoporphyrinogen oxidase